MVYLTHKLRFNKLDDLNFYMEEKKSTINPKTKEKAERWTFAGYYGKLEHLLSAALNKIALNESDNELTMEEFVQRIEKAKKEIIETMTKE